MKKKKKKKKEEEEEEKWRGDGRLCEDGAHTPTTTAVGRYFRNDPKETKKLPSCTLFFF